MGTHTDVPASGISEVERARLGIERKCAVNLDAHSGSDRARAFRERSVANSNARDPSARQVTSRNVSRSPVETHIDQGRRDARLSGGPDLLESDLPIVPIHEDLTRLQWRVRC